MANNRSETKGQDPILDAMERAARAETRATAMESFLSAAAEVIEHARREARAAALEEAAQAVEKYSPGTGLARTIRALAETPPKAKE